MGQLNIPARCRLPLLELLPDSEAWLKCFASNDASTTEGVGFTDAGDGVDGSRCSGRAGRVMVIRGGGLRCSDSGSSSEEVAGSCSASRKAL